MTETAGPDSIDKGRNSSGFQIRRAYQEAEPSDGTRVLVDRLWPRGLAKATAGFDEWLKDVAPSTELRRWYGHQAERFTEFTRRYEHELDSPERMAAVRHLRELSRNGPVTLLTATKDVAHSHVPTLLSRLKQAA